jgi:hypothetical protein
MQKQKWVNIKLAINLMIILRIKSQYLWNYLSFQDKI